MRHAILLVLTHLLTLITASQVLSPFIPAIDQFQISSNQTTATTPHKVELKPRQTTSCPRSAPNNCRNLNAATLCCASNAVCSNDNAGHVACCPSGAVCTGVVSGSTGGIVAGVTAFTTTTATGTSTAGFDQGVTATVTATNNGGIVTVQGNGNTGGTSASGGNVVVPPFSLIVRLFARLTALV